MIAKSIGNVAYIMFYHSFCEYGKRHIIIQPFWPIFLSYLILISDNGVNCDAPQEPITCSFGNSHCIVKNSYGMFPDRSTCYAANVVYPENEDQLISYVRDATKMKRKIKVITRYGHSTPKLVCPDGEDGLIISTKNLNKVIDINMEEKTMTVESGMTLQQLINEAAKVKLALPVSPYISAVTVGGMIGTGAHGSSIWGRGSAVHEYVVGLKIVSPGEAQHDYLNVRVLTVGDEHLDAAKVSLGVLGVISQEIEESNGCTKLKCITANTMVTADVASALGLTNDGVIFTGYPVIGYQHKMQASASCIDNYNNAIVDGYCAWDPRIKGKFFYSNGFTLARSKVPSFIEDIKELVKLEPTSLCSFEYYIGILMRYIKASSAYLGKDEDGVDFDITYYRPRHALSPRLNEHIIEEIEQIAIFKYGGTPHWGKNRNVAFEGVINKYKDGKKFITVKEKYDPLGLFSSEWTDQVLGLKEGLSKDMKGCALEGLCRCNNDNDCGDDYYCGNGRVYKDARVCKKRNSNLISNYCINDDKY